MEVGNQDSTQKVCNPLVHQFSKAALFVKLELMKQHMECSGQRVAGRKADQSLRTAVQHVTSHLPLQKPAVSCLDMVHMALEDYTHYHEIQQMDFPYICPKSDNGNKTFC